MAIYRFEIEHSGGSEVACNHVALRQSTSCRFQCNAYPITKETYDRLLAELEANEAAAVVGDGWKPASDPPDNSDDVIVYSEKSGVDVGYFCEKLGWHRLIAGDYIECKITHWHELPKPPSTPQPSTPPKEPAPVWQGPGWYEIVSCRD